MYAAHGFKFTNDVEACEYFNIDYNDFLKWQETNTGGWRQVEDYPKDSPIELSLDYELVDPFKVYKDVKEDVNVKEYDKISLRFTDYLCIWCDSISGILITSAVVVVVFFGVFLLVDVYKNMFDYGLDTLQEGLNQIVVSDLESSYDNRHLNGHMVKSALYLYRDTEVGKGMIVDNNYNEQILGMGYSNSDPVLNGIYRSELIIDAETEEIIGISFTIVEK